MTLSTETKKPATKSTKSKPAAKKPAAKKSDKKIDQAYTPSMLAEKKGITAKAVRAFLRRHFDVKKDEQGMWMISATMANAVLEA